MNEIEKSFADEIKMLCEDLYVTSETDAPLKVVEWKKMSAISNEVVAEKLKQSAENQLEILTFDSFFENKTTAKDWHSEEEKATLTKFVALKTYLSSKLSDIVVYKTTGDARREIAIVGKNVEGFYAGLKTYVVET